MAMLRYNGHRAHHPLIDCTFQREMERRIVAQLLTSMDDLSIAGGEGKPVVVIGATNRPEALVCALSLAGCSHMA